MSALKHRDGFAYFLPDQGRREETELFESTDYRKWTEQQTKESEQEQDNDSR